MSTYFFIVCKIPPIIVGQAAFTKLEAQTRLNSLKDKDLLEHPIQSYTIMEMEEKEIDGRYVLTSK